MSRDLNLRKGKNLIALGSLAALVGFDFHQLQETVKDLFGRRPEFIESNRIALLAGFQWVKDNIHEEVPYRLAPPDPGHEPELVMSGNRAIVAGALAAGCRFFGGYPITLPRISWRRWPSGCPSWAVPLCRLRMRSQP